MALTSDGADCFQLIDSKYKCKHFKTIRRKDLKDYYQHILGYRHVKEETILLEQILQGSSSHHHQEQEHQISSGHHGFVKYSKKRCNCKIKRISPEKPDGDNGEVDYDENSNKANKTDSASNCHFREISFLTSTSSAEKCTSILASVWHWTTFASPLGAIRTTTNSYIFNPLAETLVPYKLESSVSPSIISDSSSLSSPTRFPHSKFHRENLNCNWRSRRIRITQSQTTTEFKSSSTSSKSTCDNLYDYSNVDSTTNTFNGLTTATLGGKKQSATTATSSSFKSQQQKYPKFSCSYMLMILIMIVKELIRHLSYTLNRVRRKTQFLLPILILLQLLMAAPFTHCSSPPNTNQTLAAVISGSPSAASADELSSSSLSTSSSSTAPLNNLNVENRRIADQEKYAKSQRSSSEVSQSSSAATRIGEISHRPTGGSSITSYIGHEANIRRDPSLSYTNSGCHSCQMREQVKADNLESIKRHILLRLEMQTLPNITATQVPRTIIENFYKNHSFNGNKKTSSLSSIHSHHQDNSQLSSSAAVAASEGKNILMYKTMFVNSNSNTNSNDGHKRNDNNNMQGDDPNIFANDYSQSVNPDVDDDEGDKDDEDLLKSNLEDEFFSVINSVYVFPTMPRMRHTRKAEILNFKFKGSEHSTISQALLHVYIRGRDWIRENQPDLVDQKKFSDDHLEIIITIHRVLRRINSTIATHTININESKHKIPNGPGQWISIDVTQLVQGWVRNSTTNQGIVIKAAESWMRPFIITGDLPNNKAFTVYIEMLTKDNRKRRTKRNTSMNCSESDNEERCCRYPLVVNFVEFDWTWVVAPTQFNAYFCNGECKLGFLEKYPHTHLMQLSTAPQPCCSPTKMSPLRLLYFNTENTLVMSTIPNMAVEKCSCS